MTVTSRTFLKSCPIRSLTLAKKCPKTSKLFRGPEIVQISAIIHLQAIPCISGVFQQSLMYRKRNGHCNSVQRNALQKLRTKKKTWSLFNGLPKNCSRKHLLTSRSRNRPSTFPEAQIFRPRFPSPVHIVFRCDVTIVMHTEQFLTSYDSEIV